MKYIYFYISAFFFKIVNCVKPLIEKYIPSKRHYIVKTLSGLLVNIPYINPYIKPYINNEIEDTQLLCNSDKECDIQSEKYNEIMIVPGYMEHDPKSEALRKLKRNCFNYRQKSHSL